MERLGSDPRGPGPGTLYPKVVAGFEPNERGEDAAKLAELLALVVPRSGPSPEEARPEER